MEKVMFSINYFIKKMYNLFQKNENWKNFEDLKYEQFNEVQRNLNTIESLINDLYMQNIKKINYSINDTSNSLSDIISSIEYTKKGKKKPKIHNLIKKLESKSAKRLKKKNKIKSNSYKNLYYENNNNKNFTEFRKVIGPY